MAPRSKTAPPPSDVLEWPTFSGTGFRATTSERRPTRSRRYEEAYPAQHQALLRIFGELVAEHGYDGTQISAVVARAGVSRRTFYEHFENKEECLAELLRETGKTILDLFIEVAEREIEHGAYPTFLGIITAWAGLKSEGPGALLSPRLLPNLWSAVRTDSQLAETVNVVASAFTQVFVVAAKRLGSPFDVDYLGSAARQQVMGLIGAIEPTSDGAPKPTHEALARGICAGFGLPFPVPTPPKG